ncbi:hypothetical protein BABINDRAFT_160113 [Babjeviella inositovora NRRL Y-12698]|uniref:NmrA-like domain-containing protein n=1 Tax=Babjeviella inositovora NRRL Y-12698 TaxID=984486 RepID=A0A1E3QXU3_9ASCO|nr:uncharacterized protein BABINDRAFT_160113 [Babjeviella inositovora NRRL Y-12698]ODQ81882.1 hypothetical protein BABINDRAFT_160113 [Babjeviella inositovora NRRL Y-12698]
MSPSYKPIVAIFGSNGTLGKPILDSLTSSEFSSRFQLPIRVITRSKEGKQDSAAIKYYEASVDDTSSFKDVLDGTSVFVSLVGHAVDGKAILSIIKAAPSLKVYIPSQFGSDLDNTGYLPIPAFTGKTAHSVAAREQNPGLKVVDIYNSFFIAPGAWLYEIVGHVGIDPESKTATIRGDPAFKFNVSSFPDIANTVAVVASTPPATLKDTIKVYSDSVTQEDVISKWEQSHDVKLERKYVSAEDTLAEAKAKLADGFNFKDFFFYLQTFLSQGEGKGLAYHADNDRELLNPDESLWKWTKF